MNAACRRRPEMEIKTLYMYCAARRETGHLLISWTTSGALGTSGEKSAGNVV